MSYKQQIHQNISVVCCMIRVKEYIETVTNDNSKRFDPGYYNMDKLLPRLLQIGNTMCRVELGRSTRLLHLLLS